MIKTIFIVLCLCSIGLSAHTIKGVIYGSDGDDKKIPLASANIYWINTNQGTVSNSDGEFSISMSDIDDFRLIFSYLSYKADTVEVSHATKFLEVILIQDAKMSEELLVTDRKATAFISESKGMKTEVITQKELTKAACCDLAGAFETQATVRPQITNVITNAKELRVLGLSGVYNQILYYGLPMFQGLTYTYGISSVPGTLIDNIYVSQGANSVLQGFESFAGQINVIPKSPQNMEKILANVYMNNFEEKQFNLNTSYKFGDIDDLSTFISFHSAQPGRRMDRDNDSFLDMPLITRYSFFNQWKLSDMQNEGTFLDFGVKYMFEDRVGGQVDFNAQNDRGTLNSYGQTVRINQTEVFGKIGYRFDDDNAIILNTHSYLQNQDSYFGTLNYNANQFNYYANLEHEMIWSDAHLLKYGFSFRYQDLNEDVLFTNDDVLNRSFQGNYLTKQVIPGVFVENALHFENNKYILITGIRADNHQDYGAFITPRALFKFSPIEDHSIRLSAGTAWRQVNMFSENINLLVSSRDIVFEENLNAEEGFNWGINYIYSLESEDINGTFTLDFYQTRFSNQFFPDYDTDPTKAFIRNFEGLSVSNSLQLETNLNFWNVLELRLAYNYLDVFRDTDEGKFILPFNPENRLMTAISYRPENDKWYFDLNLHWFDKMRLPNTSLNPTEFQVGDYSEAYSVLNAQITYIFDDFELYGGVENIFDFRQLRPILSWDNPFGQYFDASFVWGPTRGREIYFGIRWTLN